MINISENEIINDRMNTEKTIIESQLYNRMVDTSEDKILNPKSDILISVDNLNKLKSYADTTDIKMLEYIKCLNKNSKLTKKINIIDANNKYVTIKKQLKLLKCGKINLNEYVRDYDREVSRTLDSLQNFSYYHLKLLEKYFINVIKILFSGNLTEIKSANDIVNFYQYKYLSKVNIEMHNHMSTTLRDLAKNEFKYNNNVRQQDLLLEINNKGVEDILNDKLASNFEKLELLVKSICNLINNKSDFSELLNFYIYVIFNSPQKNMHKNKLNRCLYKIVKFYALYNTFFKHKINIVHVYSFFAPESPIYKLSSKTEIVKTILKYIDKKYDEEDSIPTEKPKNYMVSLLDETDETTGFIPANNECVSFGVFESTPQNKIGPDKLNKPIDSKIPSKTELKKKEELEMLKKLNKVKLSKLYYDFKKSKKDMVVENRQIYIDKYTKNYDEIISLQLSTENDKCKVRHILTNIYDSYQILESYINRLNNVDISNKLLLDEPIKKENKLYKYVKSKATPKFITPLEKGIEIL